MGEGGWLSSAHQTRWCKARRAYAAIAAFLGLVALLLVGAAVAWKSLFGDWPGMRVIYGLVIGIGTLGMAIGRFLPLLPMPGKTPEEVAADRFFKGPPH
ncbi:hypothetical protein UAJ10_10740 [Nitrospirillum sp. BR 11164]|uniref:hypothetical protein n=1 Tax=Nitrospirillum sp. BR 11164 TaxID=3104324 RepID=UPI002AFED3AC|nr:hypothetical protein [Nitrospirillum sp. BR 11164]MEA1649492.1 hypothetical protein [Nitrospirillum sp. BR 11164]